MKNFYQMVWHRTNRFSPKPKIYFAIYSLVVLLVLQWNSLSKNIPFSIKWWMILLTLIPLFVMISSLGISINFFFWKNKAFLTLTVTTLFAALNAHESSTGDHSKRVAAFARIIGKWYGLNQNSIERLWFAGALHDTGKLAVAKEILKKKGPLNELELTTLRNHPQNGVKIISPLKLHWCEQAILQHHERPDGTGYPCGLSGVETIDLFARIIAIADTFDAITSHRHYRQAKSFSEAREIIIKGSGKQFDPQCIEAFIKAFPELVEVSMEQAEVLCVNE